ncbi:MAG: hypothetical protein LBT44_04695 [Clostridiales bacterium]|jgi:hypothetical protein|nr:hypothetical protein [Clostridiales bacterium]
MNAVQEQFYRFILDRVREEKKEEAESLLAEVFGKQDDSSLNAVYLASFVPKIAGMLKPEFVDEIKGAVAKFTGGVLGGLLGGNSGAKKMDIK